MNFIKLPQKMVQLKPDQLDWLLRLCLGYEASDSSIWANQERERGQERVRGGRDGERRSECRPILYIVCLLNFISSHVLYKSLQELREEVKSLMHTGLQTEIQFVLLESK